MNSEGPYDYAWERWDAERVAPVVSRREELYGPDAPSDSDLAAEEHPA